MVTRVILVRHGESSFNVERRVQGYSDLSTLTATGVAGAQQVGAALSEIAFDAVYSSPLRRAKDTAEIVLSCLKQAPKQPFQTVETLKEINMTVWEGLLFKDIEEKFPEEFEQWSDRPHELKMAIPTETGTVDFFPVLDLFERATQFWQEFLPQHQGQTVLIVAHSGINRALISTAIGLAPSQYQAVHQSNCGISVLNFSGGFGDLVQIESLNQTAHLGETLPKTKKNYTGPRFLLVRHGETDWNRDKRFQGQIDVPLNDNGRSQAQQAADYLQSVDIRYAVTSPLLRPKETAEIILQSHPDVQLELEDNLREISHGLWEGKLEAEIEADFPGELHRWQQTPAAVQMPEGENLQQVWERSIAAWNTILATACDRPVPGITLVVAHDAVNKALLCYLLGLGPEHFWSFKQGNGAVSVIDYAGADSQPVLTCINSTAHLAGGVLDQTAAGAL